MLSAFSFITEREDTMWIDYHVHSRISPDGKSSMEKMCESAAKKGIEELVFTEHYEFYKDKKKNIFFNENYMEGYIREFEKCKSQFQGILHLGLGLEMGQPHVDPENAEKIRERFPFDYLLASVHKIEDIDMKYLCGEKTRERYEEKYCQEVLKMCQTCEFDCLGHLNLYKRYRKQQQNFSETNQQKKLIEKILKTLVRRGKGIEINTSGLRQIREPLPEIGIVMRYKELGGLKITVGSDAHKEAEVGYGFEKICKMLNKAGIYQIARFSGRECFFESI